jgi:hypothetical protein
MKKMTLVAAMLLMSVFATQAQIKTEKDSIKVIINPDTVKITDSSNYVSIEVKKKDGDYILKKEISDNNITVITEKSKEWNFDIPFIGKNQAKEKYSRNTGIGNQKLNFHMLRYMEYGMGLVTATNQAEGMDVKMANCGWEFIFNNLFGFYFRATKSTQLQMNFGLNWRNYRMKNENRFLKDGNKLIVAPYPDGADIEFSRIKIFSMTTEMMLQQRLTKNIMVAIGPVVNFNTHGSIKTRYKLNGEGQKETSSHIKQNAVTVDYKAEVGINPISFYFKYSPSNVLNTDFGPEFRSMSAGLIFNIGGFSASFH